MDEALGLFVDIVSGVKAIYSQNVLHRDLKPENVFLTHRRAVIGDFGFCQILGSKSELVDGPIGTPMYMAPECLEGKRYGLQADLYSLGVSSQIFSIFPL